MGKIVISSFISILSEVITFWSHRLCAGTDTYETCKNLTQSTPFDHFLR